MNRTLIPTLAMLLAASGVVTAATPAGTEPVADLPAKAAPVPADTPAEFLARVNAALDDSDLEQGAAGWVAATYINKDTALLASRANARQGELMAELIEASKRYDAVGMDAETRRALSLLRRADYMPEHISLPSEPAKLVETTALQKKMEGAYGAGKYCPEGPDSCRNLEELEDVLANSRDWDELVDAWVGWRTVSVPMRDDYRRFVELSTEGAHELGYHDMGEMWRAGYDMSPEAFKAESERLWEQVKPLYDQLHCYVRGRLADFYGEDRAPRDGPIPAQLLGNMWSQQWAEIDDLVLPYPDAESVDVTAALQSHDYDAVRMTRTAEGFFTSLGMPALPETFWERSMLTRPRDREVVCHASAWSLDPEQNDVRIKQCLEPTKDHFETVHHELGHVYYYLAYNQLPNIYRKGAHDGFHEGIGDTLVLSMTPGYYQQIGLIDHHDENHEAVINQQMKLALDKIAFLPFGKLVDQWRWGVFAGDIRPEDYNKAWWALRTKYQGIAPPVERTETDFDPGAKYHVPGNTPYTRYFLAHILQFQFHKALCAAAGHDGPLYACSIYGSKAAGDKLWRMMALGTRQPWQDTLEAAIGTREMDASAIIAYFQPLMDWLEKKNQGQSCGW